MFMGGRKPRGERVIGSRERKGSKILSPIRFGGKVSAGGGKTVEKATERDLGDTRGSVVDPKRKKGIWIPAYYRRGGGLGGGEGVSTKVE